MPFFSLPPRRMYVMLGTYSFIHFSVGLLAGLCKKLQTDLAEILSEG